MASRTGWAGIWGVAVAACVGPAAAADVYQVTVTVGSQTATAGFTTTQQTFDGLTEAALTALLPAYSPALAATMRIDYRGLALRTAFPVPGESLLTLNIPSLGISEQFVGADREESRRLMRDYFKNGDNLGRIMRALAEVSPADPLAGNPASLQSRMVAGGFQRHFGAVAGGRPAAASSTPAARTGTSAQGGVGQLSRAGLSTRTAGLPFSVALPLGGADRPLSLDGELQHASTEGAKSYGLQLGLAYRLPLNERWTLVPAVNVGASASPDLGAAGALLSVSMTSALRLAERGDWALWMGNAVSLLRSLSARADGYDFDPQLRNTALTNGLMLSWAPPALGPNQWLEIGLSDTRYHGSALYDERSNELSLALVRASGAPGGLQSMRAELSYLDTPHSRGWGLRLQLDF